MSLLTCACLPLILSSLWPTLAPAASTEPPPPAPNEALNIADRRQVFIDQTFLQNARGVELCVHPPRKTGEMTIRPEHPWENGGIGPYSSVMKLGPTYHMWYHAMDTVHWDTGKTNGAVCYAQSKDGIKWEKLVIGLTEYQGRKDNNIVFGHGASGVRIGQDGGMVFHDPLAPTDEQFRLAIRYGQLGEGVHLFSSPDGIHWKPTHRAVLNARPQTKGHHLDSQNVIFWDDQIRKYVAYMRKNVTDKGSQGRSIARGESDTLAFPPVQDLPVVLGPDRNDLAHGENQVVDYYMSATIKYPWAENAYYMFPTAYYHYIGGALAEFPAEMPINAGPLDTQFAASRDGVHWERYDRRAFVPLGMKGDFDWASARVVWGLVPDLSGREMFLYYRGSDWLHGWDRNERNKQLLTKAGLGADQNIATLSRLVIRRDGFVSARGAYTGGEFTTCPLIFQGRRLLLNVDTSATGIVQVGLLNADGSTIDNFSLQKCDLIHTANEISRVVTWQRQSNVSTLAGKSVRLRFQVRDADLYAFQFQQ
ncbi:MAG TPA: hypothetical protein PKY77_00920 [Phycisphaerae bacterium]|nr:hypothetical protein [Phycisphaerae bacterium]HRY67583.1 hypothetical protein [Phycisphaerae bacterium]HSA24970.1 hypothetical protein [Phycisphaerae bacterium]